MHRPPRLGTAKLKGPEKDHGDLDEGAATLHNRFNTHGPLEVSEIQTGQLSAAKKYQWLQQAKENIANRKFWLQNTQGFGFIPFTPFPSKVSDS